MMKVIDETPHVSIPIQTRRVFDKVMIAIHHACDQRDFEVAEALLRTCDAMIRRPVIGGDGRNRRRDVELLVAGYERVWTIKHEVVS